MRLFLAAVLSVFMATSAIAQEKTPGLVVEDVAAKKEVITALMVVEKVVQCQAGITVMRNLFMTYGALVAIMERKDPVWIEIEGKLKSDWNDLEHKLTPIRNVAVEGGMPRKALQAIELEVFQTYTQRQMQKYSNGGFQNILAFVINSFKYVTHCVGQSDEVIEMFFPTEDSKKGE